MKRFHPVLFIALLGLLAACSKSPENRASATPDAASQAMATPPAAAAIEPAALPVVAAESAAKSVEESPGSEPGSPSLSRDIVLADSAGNTAPKTDWQYKEGEYYSTLTAAQGTSSAAGKIEVAEVFWYGCPHCYNLEPVISDWKKRLPPDVTFVRVPVMWNPTNEIHARVYYTAEALGKLDQITPAMFRGIHIDNRPLTEEKDIQKLFEENGVSAADFNKTFRSFAVESQLKRAKDLTLKYRVKGVPLLVIDGKYSTDGPQIKNQQDLLAVAEELIQRERQRT